MKSFKMGLAALCIFSAQYAVADTYPSRPITVVVPFAAGGGTDLVARLVAEKLTGILKTSVVVDNRPGASAQIGTRRVVEAEPDGHTLLIGTTSLINGPFLFSKIPYDAATQLRPVASLADLPIFLAVGSKHKERNVPAFIQMAKEAKGGLSYGSAGPGTTLHMSAEWLKNKAGFDATHIPFKGSGLAVAALAAGHVDFNLENLGPVQAMVESKRVNLLAIAASKRHPVVPDVPTFGESGLPEVNLSTWIFLMAPAQTPDHVVALLNKEVNLILAQQDVQQKLFNQGFVPTGGTPDAMLVRMKEEAKQWGAIIKAANISLE